MHLRPTALATLLVLILAHASSLFAAATGATLEGAKWLWFPDGDAKVDANFDPCYFRKTFDLPDGATVKQARLLLSADNAATAHLNGVAVHTCNHFRAVPRTDVTRHLRSGRNVLTVEAKNLPSPDAKLNPAGLILTLAIDLADGRSVTIRTDGTWKVTRTKPADTWHTPTFDDTAWHPAKEIASPGDGPWGNVGPAAPLVISVPDDFPRFEVPGHQADMDTLRQLFYLHYQPAGPLIPLWDEWMPQSTLWPARDGDALNSMRARWRQALSSRPMSADGYVLTLQHDGLAHSEGWPFPLWTQGRGAGFHFASTGIGGYDGPLVKPDNWTLTRATGSPVDAKGWPLDLTAPRAAVQSPPMSLDARHAPFLRLNWWAAGLESSNPYIEWTTKDHPDFSPDRRAYFTPASSAAQSHLYMPMGGGAGQLDTKIGDTRTMIPLHNHPKWQGTITAVRINFENPAPAKVVIKSFHSAYDTRHNINNFNFVRGVHDYFAWTADYAFLRSQMPRVRTAMRFAMREFRTREKNCVYTTWPGHEGRSGVTHVDGKKRILPGEGIGSNYWDLLPFGGEDALASIYYYDTLLKLAALEESITSHPEWTVPTGADAYDPADLRTHANAVKDYGTKRFWNEKTGRFATVDLDGHMHDYGFTFLNTEAVHFDFATPDQAKQIHAWLSGQRTIDGDTSTGPDIYHWRFGPRSTTKRNTNYYFWAWSSPESIPWGYQVQDGGAVLGWSYHDLTMRLKTAGPDDTAARLLAITDWFRDVNAEGGYRPYYTADPARGSMQGGNVAGGLGLDREFFESILVPQVMPYGFLGLRPGPDSLLLNPRLPKDWPSLRITRIHYRDAVLDITATRDNVTIAAIVSPAQPLRFTLVRDNGPVTHTLPSAPASVITIPLHP